MAAWKLDHCVYCGEVLPAGFRENFPEPEGLRRIAIPELPPEAARQLELLKVLPSAKPRSRPLFLVAGLLTVPVFAVIFYLLQSVLSRVMPGSSWMVAIVALVFFGYLAWALLRSSRR